MDRTSSPARSTRSRRAGLATTLAVSLALGTLVAADAAAAAEGDVPFAPTATIAVPAGVSDVAVTADGTDLLAFSPTGSNLVSIALDECDQAGVGLAPQDCAVDWSATLADDSRAWFVDTSGAGQVFVLAQRGADGILTRFDRSTGAVIGAPIVVAGHAVRALTYVPVSNTAYVLADDGIVLVNVATGAVTSTIAPRSDAPDPVLTVGQQAIIYNSFSTGTNNATPQGIVYAAYGEYLTTVNVATGTRVETTRRLTTAAGVSQSGISDPVAATPSLFAAGTLASGTYRTFGISSQAVHGREQNAVYLYNTLSGGSTSTSAVAWVAADPRGLALSAATNEVFAASAGGNTISVIDATSTGTTAPKPLVESISLDAAATTVAGSVDVGGLSVAPATASGVAVFVANPASRTVTVLERAPLVASSVPTISGDLRVGSTLSAETGEWTTGTEFGYQWSVDGVPVDGATAATFPVRPSDLGSVVSVEVTGAKAGYAPASLSSAATAVITEGVLVTDEPTISGAAIVDGELTASAGTWTTGAGFDYQWLVDGTPVEGADSDSFTVRAADLGTNVSVEVTGALDGYLPATRSSAATAAVAAAASVAGTPTLSGTVRVGKTLTVKPGTWAAGATLQYQWLSNGTAIAGATRTTFTPGTAQRSHRISVVVTGTRPGYETATATTAQTAKVAAGKLASTRPKLTGTASVGRTLRAVTGSWTAGTHLTYRWYANGNKIIGKSWSTLKLSSKLAGKKITVRVTGSKKAYTTVVKQSLATKKVTR